MECHYTITESMQPLCREHAGQVARLHIEGISTGFISSLGLPFVTALYEAIAESDTSFGYVYRLDDRVVGFISFTENTGRLFQFVIRNKTLILMRILVRRIFSLAILRKIIETMLYPHKSKRLDLPNAELLSIAVDPEGRGKGIAGKLITAGFEECRKRGIGKAKVLVADSNKPANNLYRKAGFEYVGQIGSHGIMSNVYVISLAADPSTA